MESVEEVLVRYGEEQDYADVEEIMQQVQKLHTRWRPDIYKDVVPILTFDTYMSFLKENQVIVAWVDGKVVGLLIYVTRNISGGPCGREKYCSWILWRWMKRTGEKELVISCSRLQGRYTLTRDTTVLNYR